MKITVCAAVFCLLSGAYASCYAEGLLLKDVPDLPGGTELRKEEKAFSYRGKIGSYVLPPSKVGAFPDKTVRYVTPVQETPPEAIQEPVEDKPKPAPKKDRITGFMEGLESMKVMYDKLPGDKTFCGAYVIIMGDISKYKTITFMVKGASGGESFEVGFNDLISSRREDAFILGSIYRYLPSGVTVDWQEVRIPVSDLFGLEISHIHSVVFNFNEAGKGTFWVDDLRFHEEALVENNGVAEKGYLLLDDFDHASPVNLLVRRTGTYKKLPSVASSSWDKDARYGDKGGSLRVSYSKKPEGQCGYYTLLNQIDGKYYDLSRFDKVSFMVKGQKGGETFELGMADKNWGIIGDSLKAGQVEKYLPSGVTTEWQEVVIPLDDFGMLDLSEMGSFVINFNKKGDGVIYIDDIKFLVPEKK